MLHQMSTPNSLQVGEDATLTRLLVDEDSEHSSSASSDAADDLEMPQGRVRNYNCPSCTFFTQNSRAYLLHTRDVHLKKIKIYDCSHCEYATRRHQKLERHVKIIHASAKDSEMQISALNSIEDLVEEVEDCDDNTDGEVAPNEELSRKLDDEDVSHKDTLTTSKKTSPKDKMCFSCKKCNYMTHVKARYTKHVKYHSMPMIKCTICDFRTPYKWNLDRHMKNHGGTGSFHCSMCNFTADIKQSLTVHEMNHHVTTAGGIYSSLSRRRNRVGASDVSTTAREDEGSGDSRSSYSNSDMGLQYADMEMVSCNNESAEETTNKHDESQEYQQISQTHIEEIKNNKQSRKIPRPIPQLIPLNTSTPNQSKSNATGEPPPKKIKDNPDITETIKTRDITITPTNITIKETSLRKKNESFFDKLKERILTETGEEGSLICKNCGFKSKCLSEHSVHEKNCTSQSNKVNTSLSNPLSSTRCQNCRHRCKSSADLYNHLLTCKREAHNIVNDDKKLETKNTGVLEPDTSNQDTGTGPHPMENIVFVWNNINREAKFDLPLDININDDSTMPEMSRSFDSEVTDENDAMNLSPSNAMGKKVFKCPHCPFWASTASRFHVHIVGHLNKKPFECSLCKYKSNWRWDITKHIKLKSARDPEHNEAKVLMTDETGRRNYSKYNKFLAVSIVNDNGVTEFHYVDTTTSADAMMEVDESIEDTCDTQNSLSDNQPLNLHTLSNEKNSLDIKNDDGRKPKKTLWKCKKCNYKDPSKEALLDHVREHSRPDQEDIKSASTKKIDIEAIDLAYRCGHCNQLSNWKHVIQRHCRLKHDGVIKVITTIKPKPDPNLINGNDPNSDSHCTKCPFKTDDNNVLAAHMQQHQPSLDSIFKCYFCPFFVKDEHELVQHLLLHGITDPEDYISKAMGCKSPLPDHAGSAPVIYNVLVSAKRHKCTECPYETNSKSQFMYHEQFHRLPADTPYKCHECNYSVSKRHLLHQHMRVHGIVTKKNDMDSETELLSTSTSFLNKSDVKTENLINVDDSPYVWVSAKNEFHKMYKCRYCSYVNSQKCKIPNHEKIHFTVFDNSEIIIYKCLECKFTCDSATKLAEHSKGHGEIYGRIYCPVEDDVPDEEQILKLRKVIENEMSTNVEDTTKDDWSWKDGEGSKILHFCQKCPARFFDSNELKLHDKFHDTSFEIKCKYCDYSVLQDNEMISHMLVHNDEYQTKTKILKFVHNSHPAHKETMLECHHCPNSSEIYWTVANPTKNFMVDTFKKSDPKPPSKHYICRECPAKFFKSSALSYHTGLHGGDGEHKCKKCSYSVKNSGNLAKHESLHENEGKSNCDYDSGEDVDYKNVPLSGTDLFQRKTEAQKRGLTDKDKLVKPNDHFPPVLQADPQFGFLMHGNPEFIYPTYLKNGRQKEKRYKCHKCPSAFEKREQYKIHLSLHGSKQRYKCELCDYSVKYYANYVQHMRKHQMNDEAQAERKKCNNGLTDYEGPLLQEEDNHDNIKLAIKTMPKGAPRSDFQQFSISDQQTLRLLQRRRSINNENEAAPADQPAVKERKLHICLLCPYSNQRQDALSNHYRRHDETDVLSTGNHKCSFCDLVVVQSHFLRDHVKTHFNYQKNFNPMCFSANENVSFTITKADSESNDATDLILDKTKTFNLKCNQEKIFVTTTTGELLVE